MGEFAAIVTSMLWSITSLQFTLAGRRVGSDAVNRLRLLLAAGLLSVVHLVVYGRIWPMGVSLAQYGWLGLSGVVGLVLGDGSLFRAFVLIGPRRSMLLMTLAPVFGALLAWVWFGETLQWYEVVAMLVTIVGIAWVVSEGQDETGAAVTDRRQTVWGILLGLGGALGQAVGLILSKQGMGSTFPALSATLIRLVAAAAVIWIVALMRRRVGAATQSLKDGGAWRFIMGGVITGPTLGVWLSMVAVQHAHVGIASTLMSLSPVMLLPLEWWLLHERSTQRAVWGTVVAVVGAAVLLMS